MKKKLLFFVTEDWYFCSHRLPLALAAKQAGYSVTVVTRVRQHGEQISAAGLKLIPLELSRRGINPFSELMVILRLASIYKSEKADIVHHVALKPVLYGSIASRLAGIPFVINALAGLGLLFSSGSMKLRLARPVFRFFFRLLLNGKGRAVILQNKDDVALLCDSGTVKEQYVTLIRGSGVDVSQYRACPEPDAVPLIVLASRLLWDKGVAEFVDAARQLKKDQVFARFALVGEGDDENPRSIDREQLQAWSDEGVIELWGKRNDMPDVFAQSHIVCLPSFYGEGVPKVLIEAAACEKPIVTTDTPGCRDIVRDNENGILVPVKDSCAVASALKTLIESPVLRKKMGSKGRALVIHAFSLDKVNQETLALYEAVQR